MAYSLSTWAARAKGYPTRPNAREQEILASVKTYVDAQVGSQDQLSELDDTNITTPASGHVLIYDGTDSWDNKAVSGDISISSAGVVAIAAGVVVDADINASAAISGSKLAEDVYRSASGTITSAEILALNATPKELIAAPGAGKYIVVDEIELFLDYGAAQYAADAGEDFTIQYATSDTAILSVDNDGDGFLLGATDARRVIKPAYLNADGSGSLFDVDNADNEAVEAQILVGEWITGDSDIKWKIKYHIETQQV